ncbi:hypothetical protein DH2020_049283 [Rehmannia glutinosa]|uniref:Uncharacterized protein n=1 Tax=Rehmannia glutinosa TaxID=99300 RepID=A0ABR0U344_REHGL
MLCVSLPGLSNHQMTKMITARSSLGNFCRYEFDGLGGFSRDCGKGKRNCLTKRLSISSMASSALVLEAARDKFTREISFQSKDKDISLAKALLYVAAEDEAYLALNRELDARSIHNERKDISPLPDAHGWDSMEAMPMAGKNINEWLAELDTIAKEVEAELVPREIGCDLVEVLEAVNKVLFESRGFKRLPVLVDSKCSYLHSVLGSGCASGHSLFGVLNGKCVDDPRSRASDINGNSLLGLDIATNRDIIGIALANLIRLYWKRASRTNYGLMLTSPLRSVYKPEEKFNKNSGTNMPLLRPQELRFEMLILQDWHELAMMASERLLILQPHNWALRRDYGMMLYYNRFFDMAPNGESRGHSLFGVVNGKCVDDPRSRASDINGNSLLGLDIATNRDIIGIALANLIRLYWKRASRTNYGLMLTSPLRSVYKPEEKFNKNSGTNMPLLRPQELRFEMLILQDWHELAMMASERLLILQPHNWALRRDYGMMLYYNREYEAAVQELSICMAFAPEDEAEVLEPFVEKLHLMRIETSWKKSLRLANSTLS